MTAVGTYGGQSITYFTVRSPSRGSNLTGCKGTLDVLSK